MPSSQILNNKSQYSESWNIGFYYGSSSTVVGEQNIGVLITW